jgi:hypothetical protein
VVFLDGEASLTDFLSDSRHRFILLPRTGETKSERKTSLGPSRIWRNWCLSLIISRHLDLLDLFDCDLPQETMQRFL